MEKKIITLLSLLLATALQMTASDDVTASVYNNRAARLQNGLVDVKIDKSGKIYYLGRNGKNLLGSEFIYLAVKLQPLWQEIVEKSFLGSSLFPLHAEAVLNEHNNK